MAKYGYICKYMNTITEPLVRIYVISVVRPLEVADTGLHPLIQAWTHNSHYTGEGTIEADLLLGSSKLVNLYSFEEKRFSSFH